VGRLSQDKIKNLLELNKEVRVYLLKKYPDHQTRIDNMVYWYLSGLKEEYLRLLFRIPDGVKNIDLDCIEINDKGNILGIIEFKRGLDKAPSYAQQCILTELKEKLGVPCYVLGFNDEFTKFNVTEIGSPKGIPTIKGLDQLWNWRYKLHEELPSKPPSISLVEFFEVKPHG